MFIAYTNNNERFVEGKDYNSRAFTWDDIPTDVNITALALTHPIPLTMGKQKFSSKVSIKKYHYYYFFNEVTMSIAQSNSGGSVRKNNSLIAKVIAGVDVDKGYVLEVRLDKFGNTSINSYPLQGLMNNFKNGNMHKTILKTGIVCAKGKKLI